MALSIQKKVLNLNVGEPFIINLDNKSSTGYEWYLSHMDDGIMLLSANYKTTPRLANNPGIQEKASFCFASFNECKGQLKFIYKKPWEVIELMEVVYDVNIYLKR